MKQVTGLVAVLVALVACGPSLPEGDEGRLRELRQFVRDACDNYAFGMSTLQEPLMGELARPAAVADFLEAAAAGESAYDLMFQIRRGRTDAGYTESGDLLHDFPSFGAFLRLADYLSAGPAEFTGYEVLFAEAVRDADESCERAFAAVVELAEDAS